MGSHELEEQLRSLGRRPTPPPRPEFVEGLLERLLADDFDTDSTVVPFERRRHRLAGKVVWMASAAAALLIAVLAVSMVDRGSGRPPATAFALASTPGEVDGVVVTVDDQGFIADLPESRADGPLTFTCTEDGRFRSALGREYECDAGQEVTVQVEQRSIVGVVGLPPVADPEPPSVVRLDFEQDASGTPLSGTWSWEEADPAGFDRYLLLRRQGADPVYGGQGTQVVAEVADRATVTHRIDDLPLGSWTYQLLVLDPEGDVTALSDLVTLEPTRS